jgi:ABC-type multidrug transport system ATPase subunit
MEYAVEIKGIRKNYGDVEALHKVDINIGKGEIFGFIGPDGAGKTTIFRILTSLLLPDEGTAKVAGCDVVADYKELRTKIGYMPGRFSLYQDLTVAENLKFFAGIFKTTIEENYSLIEDIYKQIEPFKNRRAGKLSGGMKQKLALSCALIHRPEVLFLDEPTTGVDVVSRAEFWQMLQKRRDEGITIVVSTPYMDEAALCDRVALIQKGKVMSTDTPQNIVENFGKPVFSVKAANSSILPGLLSAFEGTSSQNRFGDNFHWIPAEGFDEKDLRQYFEKAGINNCEIERISPGIEDCFIELMTQ